MCSNTLQGIEKKDYYDRVHLSNLNVEQTAKRLASHPEWFPDIDISIDGQKCCVQLGELPCTVVKPEGIFTKETFWTNCNNMYTLSINQQNHQLRWFQLFLEVIESNDECITTVLLLHTNVVLLLCT